MTSSQFEGLFLCAQVADTKDIVRRSVKVRISLKSRPTWLDWGRVNTGVRGKKRRSGSLRVWRKGAHHALHSTTKREALQLEKTAVHDPYEYLTSSSTPWPWDGSFSKALRRPSQVSEACLRKCALGS